MDKTANKETVTNISESAKKTKKLVQARLPFKIISVKLTDKASSDQRKRKLSSPEDENRLTKVGRLIEIKENFDHDKSESDISLNVNSDDSDVSNLKKVDIPDDDIIELVDDYESENNLTDTSMNDNDIENFKREKKIDNSSKLVIKLPPIKKRRGTEKNLISKKNSKKLNQETDHNKDGDNVEELSTEISSSGITTNKDIEVVQINEEKKIIVKQADNKFEYENKGDSESIDVKNSINETAKIEKNSEKVQSNIVHNEKIESESNKEIGIVSSLDCNETISKSSASNSNDASCLANEDNSESENDQMSDKDGQATLGSTPKSQKLNDNEKLTPKQIAKRLEIEKRREEKLKTKLDRDRKLQEDKDLKQKEREEKERQRKKEREEKEEQKRKEREEKEEQKKKERDEREKKRLAELEMKNEEKRIKEEERKKKEEQKEEERKKKEEQKEERRKKEEADMKKRQSQSIMKFFVPKLDGKNVEERKSPEKRSEDSNSSNLSFMPFCVKGDMKLAPRIRRVLTDDEKCSLEKVLLSNKSENKRNNLYLGQLKNENYITRHCGKTWLDEDDGENDIILIEDELGDAAQKVEELKPKGKYRAKYLMFSENQRPPYYGTWRKKSTNVKARKPFNRDEKIFDYTVDSDEEWEEEEPGESLHGSDDEKESEDEYEVDNDFFVPHGHLSDEEMQEDENDEDNSPETQKAKLKILQLEFAAEMKKKTEKIKPRLIGYIWQNPDGSQPSSCPNIIWEMLEARAMIYNQPIELLKVEDSSEQSFPDATAVIDKRVKITDQETKELIRLVHGNINKCSFLVKEFQVNRTKQNEGCDTFKDVSNISCRKKIKELAVWRSCPDEGPMQYKYCWYVSPSTLEKYDMSDLKLPNSWNYILTPKRIDFGNKEKEKEIIPPVDESDVKQNSNKKQNTFNITKFTKILSDDDKKKQFTTAHTGSPVMSTSVTQNSSVTDNQIQSINSPDASTKPAKKRVPLLMSVPRGQQIPQQSKSILISQFLKDNSATKKRNGIIEINENNEKNENETAAKSDVKPMEIDEVILIAD